MKIKFLVLKFLLIVFIIVSCDKSENNSENNTREFFASFIIESVDTLQPYYHPKEKIYAVDSSENGWGWISQWGEEHNDSVWVTKASTYWFDKEKWSTCDHITIAISKLENINNLMFDSVDRKWKYPNIKDEVKELFIQDNMISVQVNHCFQNTSFVSGTYDGYVLLKDVQIINQEDQQKTYGVFEFEGITRGYSFEKAEDQIYELKEGIFKGIFEY